MTECFFVALRISKTLVFFLRLCLGKPVSKRLKINTCSLTLVLLLFTQSSKLSRSTLGSNSQLLILPNPSPILRWEIWHPAPGIQNHFIKIVFCLMALYCQRARSGLHRLMAACSLFAGAC